MLGTPPMRSLLCVAAIATLLTGCALICAPKKIFSMDVRLPSASVTGGREDTKRLIRVVGATAKQYGLSAQPPHPRPEGPIGYVIPGFYIGVSDHELHIPCEPDVDWDAATHWQLSFVPPHGSYYYLTCAVAPPYTGNVAQVSLWVDYNSKLPVETLPLWQELTRVVAKEFGQSAILKLDSR